MAPRLARWGLGREALRPVHIIVLCSWARHITRTVLHSTPPESTNGYRGVGGEGGKGMGREFAIDRLSFYLGEVAILLVSLYHRNCDKLRLNVALGSNVDLTLLFSLLQSLDRISSPKAKQRRLHQFPDTPPTNLR